MPNWTQNTLKCNGLLNIIKEKGYSNENSVFSFDKVKPMPKELDIVSGSETNIALYYYNKQNGIRQNRDSWLEEQIGYHYNEERKAELYKMGEIVSSNIKNYGHATWYGWCNQNWGVKWDACDTYEVDEDTIEFQTPWGPPTPIYIELSKQNPDVEFEIEYIQEDGGKGTEIYLNGECVYDDWDEDFHWWDDEE